MTFTSRLTGIILSGGMSSRMGTEKGMVNHRGKRLIEYSIDALKPVCDQLIISSNKDCYSYLNIPIVPDEIKNCGPIGGIYSCMKKFPSDRYIILSCDVPNITSVLFSDLLVHLDNFDAVIPIDVNGRKQPLAACYSSSSFPIIATELKNNRFKMMSLLSLFNVQYFSLLGKEIYSNKLFLNANYPNDLTDV